MTRRTFLRNGGALLGGVVASHVIFYAEAPGLLTRRAQGLLERVQYPGKSHCGRCWRPWGAVEGHSTVYLDEQDYAWGMFPLCEQCWTELETPHERLPYYMDLLASWERDGDSTYHGQTWTALRALVETAVLRGG